MNDMEKIVNQCWVGNCEENIYSVFFCYGKASDQLTDVYYRKFELKDWRRCRNTRNRSTSTQDIKFSGIAVRVESFYFLLGMCLTLLFINNFLYMCRNWETTTNNIIRIVNFDHFVEFGYLFSKVIHDWPLIWMIFWELTAASKSARISLIFWIWSQLTIN
jgi:hypothetical protein